MPADDATYLSTLVALRTGLSQPSAQDRITAVTDKMRHDADVARKAGAALALFTGLSLLIGAFIACTAGLWAVCNGTNISLCPL